MHRLLELMKLSNQIDIYRLRPSYLGLLDGGGDKKVKAKEFWQVRVHTECGTFIDGAIVTEGEDTSVVLESRLKNALDTIWERVEFEVVKARTGIKIARRNHVGCYEGVAWVDTHNKCPACDLFMYTEEDEPKSLKCATCDWGFKREPVGVGDGSD